MLITQSRQFLRRHGDYLSFSTFTYCDTQRHVGLTFGLDLCLCTVKTLFAIGHLHDSTGSWTSPRPLQCFDSTDYPADGVRFPTFTRILDSLWVRVLLAQIISPVWTFGTSCLNWYICLLFLGADENFQLSSSCQVSSRVHRTMLSFTECTVNAHIVPHSCIQ